MRIVQGRRGVCDEVRCGLSRRELVMFTGEGLFEITHDRGAENDFSELVMSHSAAS